jgi:hypothetical protein
MGLIHIYRGIGQDFDTVSGVGKLGEILPDIDFSRAVALEGGARVGPEHEVTAESVVFVRRVPQGVTAALIITGVVAVCAGVGGGIALYQSRVAMEEAENAMKSSRLDDVDALPFCRGASNQGAQGRALPYIIGEAYFTPVRSQPKTFVVSGTNGTGQRCLMTFEAGYKNLVFKKVFVGEHVVWENAGATVPQDGQFQLTGGSRFGGSGSYVEFRQGGVFTDPMLNVKVVSDYYREMLDHPYGARAEELKHFYAACPENTMAVDVTILFDGLRKKNGDSYESRTATIKLWWSNLDDPDPENDSHWTEFAPGEMFDQNGTRSGTFTYNSKTQMRFTAHKDFSISECRDKKISIRAMRTSPRAESGSQENCYLYFINSKIFDPQKTDDSLVPMKPVEDEIREMTTRLAVVVNADKDTDENFDRISFVAVGTAPVWEGTADNGHWTVEKVPTRNPASWLLEVMTSDVHVHSRYSRDELDLDSFGAWYVYCEEKGYHVGGVIDSDMKKEDICSRILAAGDASLLRNNQGFYSVAIDKAESVPVALLNAQDVRSPSVSKNFCRRADGRKVTFLNRETWKMESLYIMRDGSSGRTPQDVITEDSPPFITDAAHAIRYERRKLAQEYLQPKTLSVKVGPEGAYYPIYSLVKVQLPQIQAGTASSVIQETEIIDGRLTRVRLANKVTLSGTLRNGAVIWAEGTDGKQILELEISGTGETSTLIFTEPPRVRSLQAVPRPGNIVSLGVLDGQGRFETVTRPYKVMGFSRADYGYTLELKDYCPEIYEDGPVPDYVSVVSPRIPAKPGIDLSASASDLLDMSVELSREISSLESGATLHDPSAPVSVLAKAERDWLSLSCEPGGSGLSETPHHVVWALSRDAGSTWTEEESSSADMRWTFDRAVDGYPECTDFSSWRVKCRIVNLGERTGPWSQTATVDVTGYGTWVVGAPVITSKVVDRTVILQMSMANPQNREIYGNIRYHVRVRRGAIPGYHSVKYWMHDTDGDEYWYLLSNDGKLDESVVKDDGWTQGTQAQYTEDSPDPFVSLEDPEPGRTYAYCVNETDIPGDSVWHKPTVRKDPYADSGNYYDADSGTQDGRYVVSDGTYTQTMPLWFDDGTVHNLMNTPYCFDVRCVNEAGAGDWYSGAADWSAGHDGYQVVALCTNIRDIVRANETAKQAYIEELSAITANLGEISEGSLAGSANNYWTLSTKPGANQNKDYQGAFRVGDDKEFFQVEPRIVNGQIAGYNISLKASNISFSSNGGVEVKEMDLTSGTFIYDSNDSSVRLYLSAQGIEVQKKIDDSQDWTPANIRHAGMLKIHTIRHNGVNHTSLIITDDEDSVRFGETVENVTIYHFSGNVLDENGADPKSLNLSASKLDKDGYLSEGYAMGSYNGIISAEQDSQSVLLTKANLMYINGQTVTADGTLEGAPLYRQLNEAAAASWGLTQAQINSGIFRGV